MSRTWVRRSSMSLLSGLKPFGYLQQIPLSSVAGTSSVTPAGGSCSCLRRVAVVLGRGSTVWVFGQRFVDSVHACTGPSGAASERWSEFGVALFPAAGGRDFAGRVLSGWGRRFSAAVAAATPAIASRSITASGIVSVSHVAVSSVSSTGRPLELGGDDLRRSDERLPTRAPGGCRLGPKLLAVR